MLLKAIDKLLDQSFRSELNYKRLNRLESDVWAQIRQSRAAVSSMPFMLPIWSNTQLRYASLTLALIGGLIVSQYSIKPQSTRADTFGLDAFSPNAPFLMTSTFNQISLTPS